jgi:hypothetical protein
MAGASEPDWLPSSGDERAGRITDPAGCPAIKLKSLLSFKLRTSSRGESLA